MSKNALAGKIAITGTGRCGTTFLMRLITRMSPEATGYIRHDMEVMPDAQCGMERVVSETSSLAELQALPKVWKDPGLMERLPGLVARGHVPALLIIPVRDIDDAAYSRIENNRPWFPRGEPHSDNMAERVFHQAEELRVGFGRLVETACLHQIPTTMIPWEHLEENDKLWDELGHETAFGTNSESLRELLGWEYFHDFEEAHYEVWGHKVKTFIRKDGARIRT